MRKIANRRWVACLAVILAWGAGGLGSSLALDRQQPKPLRGITKTSDDRTISYVHTGRISEVKVKEGDSVSEGQLIAQQEDSVEQAALAAAKEEAEDTTELEINKAVRAKDAEDVVIYKQ